MTAKTTTKRTFRRGYSHPGKTRDDSTAYLPGQTYELTPEVEKAAEKAGKLVPLKDSKPAGDAAAGGQTGG